MHEDDENKDNRHPFAVVEQSVWKRHHRKPLNASLGFLYHRVDDLPAPCGHLFDVLYGHLSRLLLGVRNSHECHLIRLMLRVRRAVSQLLDLFEHILHFRNHAAHLPCDAFVAPALLGDKVFQLLHGSDEVGLVVLILKPSSGVSGIPRFLGELKLLADNGAGQKSCLWGPMGEVSGGNCMFGCYENRSITPLTSRVSV